MTNPALKINLWVWPGFGGATPSQSPQSNRGIQILFCEETDVVLS